jgi:hypothetical protein
MTITLEAMPEVRRITPGNRLGLALFLAAVIHAIIIFRVGFGADLKAHVNPPSLDVVLARRAAHQAPKKADFIASANQQASESADTKLIPTRPVLGPAPLSTARVTPIAVRAAPTQTKSLERMRLMQTRADLRIADQQRHRPLRAHKIDNSRAGQSGNRAADLRTDPRRAALCKASAGQLSGNCKCQDRRRGGIY